MMKRRISTEQLQELTDEQKQKLRELWQPEEGDFYIHGHHFFINQVPKNVNMLRKEHSLPLLDIGQMMELLSPDEEVIFSSTKYYSGFIELNINGTSYVDNTICDALWQAVKELLQEENKNG